MPYIKESLRAALKPEVDALVDRIKDIAISDDREGILNYVITSVVARAMRPSAGGWKYKDLSRAHSVFIMAAAEFYRRLVASHEDDAKARNRDIPEYWGES